MRGCKVQPSCVLPDHGVFRLLGNAETLPESYAGGWPDYSTRLQHLRETAAGSAPALLAEFAEAGRTSLEGLLKTVDPESLEKAVKLLANAQTIHIVGIRRAFPVASYLAYALEKMEVPAMLHSAVGKLENLHAIREGDVLLAITFSPYSPETVAMAEAVAARGIDVVGITDTFVSPMSKHAKQTLLVSEVDFGAFRSSRQHFVSQLHSPFRSELPAKVTDASPRILFFG